MQSKAKTVAEYLKSLPPDRRAAISAVRQAMLKALPKGYQEMMHYGMISYVVPLKLYPNGYCDDKSMPLPYAALASQKNHMAVYLMNIYSDRKLLASFTKSYKASGKRLDMGKSCVRFRKLDDLPLIAIAKAIKATPVKEWVAQYETSRGKR